MNHADKEINFDAETLQMGVRGYPQIVSARPNIDFFNSGYTPRQLRFGGNLSQVSNFLTPMKPGRRTHSYSRLITLRPREEVPFVIHGMRREPGEYELAATASYYDIGDNKWVPLAAAVPINLPVAHDNPKSVHPLKVESRFIYEDEWLVAEGVISDPSDMGLSVFTKESQGLHFLPGLVQIYSDSGKLLQADLDWIEPDGSWKKSLVKEGLPFKFRIRNEDRFSRVNLAKVGLWTVTSRGLERLILSDHIATRTRPAIPPWGASIRGCRMRIDLPRTTFVVGEKIRFFVQAESDGSEADMLWVNQHKFWSQVVATIDGKNARIESGGVSDAIVYEFPFQVDVNLALIEDLTQGKHVLQFSVKGDAGIYGKNLRKLDATLVSNLIEFEVR